MTESTETGARQGRWPLTFGSLFTGIGGIDLGLERAGWECAWQVEIDPWCQRVLAKHWPDVTRYGDIKEIDPHELEPVDLVCGGFPCQPVSRAGRRMAQADDRWLWPAFADVVRGVRPRFVLVENVPGLLVHGMGDVLGDLAALGFDAEWESIPAAAVGAPHLRDRVWIVATRADSDSVGREVVGGLQPGVGPRDDADGLRAPLADTEAQRRGTGRRPGEVQGVEVVERPAQQPRRRGSAMADAEGERRPERRRPVATGKALAGTEHGREVDDTGRGRHRAPDETVFPRGRTPQLSGWWATEPDVGGTLDGFSAWLDGSGVTFDSHQLVSAYGKATSAGPDEVLRTLRCAAGEETHSNGAPRGSVSLSPQEILLAYLRQLAADIREGRHASVAGTATSQGCMRSLRTDDQPSCPPLRRSTPEQRRLEPSDALRALSQLLARHAESAWSAYRRSDAAPVLNWEAGYARVAHGIPGRVDRLRGLGNAVVPQVVEWIGRRMIEVAA